MIGRISVFAILSNFEMDVRPSRAPGGADATDLCACCDIVANLHIDALHMRVDGLPTVSVIDGHRIAPGLVAIKAITRVHDTTGRRRADRRSR